MCPLIHWHPTRGVPLPYSLCPQVPYKAAQNIWLTVGFVEVKNGMRMRKKAENSLRLTTTKVPSNGCIYLAK